MLEADITRTLIGLIWGIIPSRNAHGRITAGITGLQNRGKEPYELVNLSRTFCFYGKIDRETREDIHYAPSVL